MKRIYLFVSEASEAFSTSEHQNKDNKSPKKSEYAMDSQDWAFVGLGKGGKK